jgi:hypothetical protein
MNAYSPALIEIVADSLYRQTNPRRRWEAKAIPLHIRDYYRSLARAWTDAMGGEAELIAFCEAVLAARAASS